MYSVPIVRALPSSPLTLEPALCEVNGLADDPHAWILVRESDGLSYLVSARWLLAREEAPLVEGSRGQMLYAARHFAARGGTVAFVGEGDRTGFARCKGTLFPKDVEPWFVPG